MKNVLKFSVFGIVVAAALTGLVWQQSAQSQQPAPGQQSENGRYQIVMGSEGNRGSVLFLLDTKDGGTWIYRPPSPPAFNGFWSDIPRLTYPPETWQQVFQQMVKQAQEQSKVPATPSK